MWLAKQAATLLLNAVHHEPILRSLGKHREKRGREKERYPKDRSLRVCGLRTKEKRQLGCFVAERSVPRTFSSESVKPKRKKRKTHNPVAVFVNEVQHEPFLESLWNHRENRQPGCYVGKRWLVQGNPPTPIPPQTSSNGSRVWTTNHLRACRNRKTNSAQIRALAHLGISTSRCIDIKDEKSTRSCSIFRLCDWEES